MFVERFKSIKRIDTCYMGTEDSQNVDDDPSYEELQTGVLGHVEVVVIKFNPDLITYSDLCHYFFSIHDPTTFCQQGKNIGQLYQSSIFYGNEI